MSPTAAYRLIQLFEILRCQYGTVKCNGSFDCGTTVNLALIKLSQMHVSSQIELPFQANLYAPFLFRAQNGPITCNVFPVH
eukprot:scaffold31187_cov49-Cyclotella_meneghiniana.AAC.4